MARDVISSTNVVPDDMVIDVANRAGLAMPPEPSAFPLVPARREEPHKLALGLADLTAVLAALTVLALVSRLDAALLLVAPLMVLLFKIAGLYERDELVLNKTTLEELPAVVQLCGLFTLLVWLGYDGVSKMDLNPRDMLGLWAATGILVLVGRVIARRILGARTAPERCLLIGAPDSLEMLARKLAVAPVCAEVVAEIPLDREGIASLVSHPWRMSTLTHEYDVHRVVIAPSATDGYDTLELIRLAMCGGVRVSVLPRLLGVVGTAVEFDEIEGLTLLGVRSFGLSRSSFVLKRAFDIVLASAGMIATAPVMAAIALAIRLDSHGPVLFRQTRIGRDGHPFQILKFRSMVSDAETRRAEVEVLNETSGLFKSSVDPRRTRVGRLLRETYLDELPQLINVLKGEMSLVGPRPLVVDEDAKVAGLDRARLHLTPGMTGHWQILGSTRLPLDEMVGIDYLYVANWTVWTDCKILLRTIAYVVGRRGM